MKFTALMALAFPVQRGHNLRAPSISRHHGLALPPNDQLLCFDNLYYAANVEVLFADFTSSLRLRTRRRTTSNATIAPLGAWLESTCTGTHGLRRFPGCTSAGRSDSVLTL